MKNLKMVPKVYVCSLGIYVNRWTKETKCHRLQILGRWEKVRVTLITTLFPRSWFKTPCMSRTFFFYFWSKHLPSVSLLGNQVVSSVSPTFKVHLASGFQHVQNSDNLVYISNLWEAWPYNKAGLSFRSNLNFGRIWGTCHLLLVITFSSHL